MRFSFRKILKTSGILFTLLMVVYICYLFITVMIARNETPRIAAAALAGPGIVLQPEELTAGQLEILLKVEDPNFFYHRGVDFRTPGGGITTITQGLVKQLYFENFKPGLAKIRQSLIARFALDPMVTKKNQLKLFINRVYLGNVNGRTVYGFNDAAKVYFGKRFKELTENEYISIVAMIIDATTFNIKKNPEANADRVQRIKLLLSGEYKPKSLMDLYYGGKYAPKGFLNRLIWGY